MAVADSLIGNWKLVPDGSDFLPGLDALSGSPLVLKLLGISDPEFFKIEKKKMFQSEYICFTYVTKNSSLKRAYQFATLNYESLIPPNLIFAIVHSCNDSFTEFTIYRMGPQSGQSSKEIYKLNQWTGEIKLQIELTTGEGTHLKLTKYLTRFDSARPGGDVILSSSLKSMGWGKFEFWPSSVLQDCTITIVKAMTIRMRNEVMNEDINVVDSLWIHNDFKDNFDFQSISGQVLTLNQKDGEEFIVYIIQISYQGGSPWFVSHRYNDFQTMKDFILMQNFHNTVAKDLYNSFPGKAVYLSYRSAALVGRIDGLNKHLQSLKQNARFLKQTSIDAIYSFLLLPENISTQAGIVASSSIRNNSSNSLSSGINSHQPAHPSPLLNLSNPPTTAGDSAPSTARDYLLCESPANTSYGKNIPIQNGAYNFNETETGFGFTSSSKKNNLSDDGNEEVIINTKLDDSYGGIGSDADDLSILSPEERLLTVLGKNGMKVIKHGRQGLPKLRTLHCDVDARRLYWSGGDGGSKTTARKNKSIVLAEVKAIQLGNEIDNGSVSPGGTTSAAERGGRRTSKQGTGFSRLSQILKLHPQSTELAVSAASSSSASSSDDAQESIVLYGTENLRRYCTNSKDLMLSFSLILPTRTFDVQCLNEEDHDLLLGALRALCCRPSC